MGQLFSISLLSLLASEYGLRSREAARAGFVSGWDWRRTGLRLALWLVLWLASFGSPGASQGLLLALFALSTEAWAIVARRGLRAELESGSRYGRPQTHLLPLPLSAALPLVYLASVRWLGLPPLSLAHPAAAAVVRHALALVGLWCWSTMITISLIDLVRPEQVLQGDGARARAGEVIGILERLLVYLLVTHNGLTAVGFVAAAKSAARFPEFKKVAFAEYFLIGTLTSVGLATAVALLLGAS